MKIRSFAFLVALLITAAVSCKNQESSTAPSVSTSSSITATQTSSSAAALTVTTQAVPNPVTVVLRVSGAAHLADGMNPPVIIVPNFTNESHQAFLAALPIFVAENGLPNSHDQIDKDDGDKLLNKFMYGEIQPGVEIDLKQSGVSIPADSTVKMDVGDDSKDVCPIPAANSTTKDTSLHWLPRLWKVSKATKPFQLKESFTKKDPDPKVVIARLEAKTGTLDTELTSEQRKFAFRIEGKKVGDDVVQTVAMSLRYTFELPEGTIKFILKGRKFGTDGTHQGDIIPLGTFKPDSRNRIEIDLLNMPEDEFFNVHDTHSIPHFDLAYRIIEGDDHKTATTEFAGKCRNGHRPLFECGPTH